ncbi:unnamed protein product [Schistosoma rodhaini]|uniref:Centromere protein L n=1 Tax=Schistosoma rodhaini TaxID=6188 RepID=A0AA85FZM6_9TREM|nr:unnamed protein product [Schistosoma rodhaini]CAH8571077.1 unnamed protein product [Schistosoma rodhaini]
MNCRIVEGIICTAIDSEVNCPCDECKKRHFCNGISFFFLKDKFWVETVSEEELFQRLKTLNPQFEFQRDTLHHTIRDCFNFGEVVADIQYAVGESVITWTSDAVVPVSSVLHYHVILPLSFALESLCKKQDLLNNKLLALNHHANRLHEKLMLPMGEDLKKEDVDLDFSYSYNFSKGLLSSSSTQHLFCEASKHLFTSKIENMCTSPVQQKQPTREIISSNSNSEDVQETEEKRRNELQKKLANKLGKFKSKKLERRGILRK